MFRGTSTALITPFCKDGSVDEDALRRLVDFQEENGVNTLVPCGSTGESAMLNHDEHLNVIKIVVDQAKKAKVLAGAGSNCTSEAIILSKAAADLGVDGLLSISPYYVKPTQEGIYLHFEAIASAVDVPLVVYNIPGRTGSNITAETLLRLAELDGISSVKEASGNMEQIEAILAGRPKGFEVLSGDDGLTYELMSKGGDGVISVTSNCCPDLMSGMVNNLLEGKMDEAAVLRDRMAPLFKGLFVESNPIPIKYVMKGLGFGNGCPRLPLTELTQPNQTKLDEMFESVRLSN